MQNKFTEAETKTCFNMKSSQLKAKEATDTTDNKLRKGKKKKKEGREGSGTAGSRSVGLQN